MIDLPFLCALCVHPPPLQKKEIDKETNTVNYLYITDREILPLSKNLQKYAVKNIKKTFLAILTDHQIK